VKRTISSADTEIVAAYVSNNPIPVSEVPAIISRARTLGALVGASQGEFKTAEKPSVRSAVGDADYIILLEDGEKA